jgi:hypothetical protein
VPRVLDWNPDDPDTVKVHYDVSAWSFDQRAGLTEALADADIAHVWEDDEVVVPEELEADVDALFERLERILGPFAVALPPDESGLEYELDEWAPADRLALSQALVEAEVPHRWEGMSVVVASDAEETVDEMLDAIEQGTLVLAGAGAAGAPENALSTLFTAADRLARDPEDGTGSEDLQTLVPALDPQQPPYGVTVTTWAKIVDAATVLSALTDEPEPSSSDVIGAAQQLRSLVRQYV